jgi:hypothetical protein
MPDFDQVHRHARTLAALTDPERQEQRQVITWPVEVAEHWEALIALWQDPARNRATEETAETAPARRDRREPAELERIEQIQVDARRAIIQWPEQPQTRKARCGNCGTRYAISDDPVSNHHIAMRHAQICPKRATADEHAKLVLEYWDQPMPRAFARRAQEMIAAGANPAIIRTHGVNIFEPAPAERPRPWWKFWRRS